MLKNVKGKKGGGKGGGGGSYHTPVEAPTKLQSNTIVRILDLLSEGEIVGLVDSYKSVYLDETPIQQSNGTWNYNGITIYERKGTPTQSYIPGITDISPTTTVINTEVTNAGGGVVHTITDTDVDDVKVILRVINLFQANDQGDLLETSVSYAIDVAPNGGSYTTVKTGTITDRRNSPYDKRIRIKNLAQYGSGPWNIRVRKTTADSSSNKLVNNLYFYAIVEIKNRKIQYRDSAIVGFEADLSQYNTTAVPTRYYDIYGLKIKVPSNRNQNVGSDTVTYTGAWDGTFKTEWTDNPAWIIYDLLTNTRYGMGIDEEYVDKWALYTIGYYCDELVDDGQGGQERRYTFNGIINTRQDAINLINTICAAIRVMPYWSGGLVTFSQDSPKDATRLVTAANIENGIFNYSSTSYEGRHSVVYVTWFDPDNFCRPAVEVVEDTELIEELGYKTIDVVAHGCTSRGQAARYGKWILETEKNETDIVTYVAGLDHADAVPGEIIKIADPLKSTTNRYGGRLVSCSATSCVIDNAITIEAGKTYTINLLTSSGTIQTRTLTNSAGTTTTLTWSDALTDIPNTDSVWVISETDIEPKTYRIVNVKELDKHKYQITAAYHDPTKYTRIEQGIYLDTPPYTNIPLGEVSPPTNLELEPYTYTDGAGTGQKYGILASWYPSDDARVTYYQLQHKLSGGVYENIVDVIGTSYKIQPVSSGINYIRIRAMTPTAKSTWLEGSTTVITTVSGLSAPQNLELITGGTTFSGVDVNFKWDPPAGCYYNNYDININEILDGYKIEIYKPSDDTLLRTINVDKNTTQYIYNYSENLEDFGNNGSRTVKVKVYAKDVYGQYSPAITNTFSNPAPDMSSTTPTITSRPTSLLVEWTNVNDNDMYYYNIYCDTNNPPTTLVARVNYPTNKYVVPNLNYGTDYYVQIEPYDHFGVGSKSALPGSASPTKIPNVNIDVELTKSITITDNASTASGTLAELYDRVYSSGGPNYSNGHYVEYDFGIEYFIDRLSIWTSAAANIYIAYQRAGGSWQYLKAETDHTLDSDGKLLNATSESDAQTNYWTTTNGINVALFPEGIIALKCRVYLLSNVQVHELVFGREVIAEFVNADQLSAISANLGSIQAGTLQSDNYSSSEGMLIDLDNKKIYLHGSNNPSLYYNDATNTLEITGKVIFTSGSSGYNNLSDKPTQLADINSSEGNKLSSVENGADVTANHTANNTNNVGSIPASNVAGWAHSSDTTTIDGGKIYTGTVTADAISVSQLSAISADIGDITAGTLQSSNYSSSEGMSIDLNAKKIYLHGSSSPSLYYDDATGTLEITGKVNFTSGSSGYNNLTDKPSQLSDINSSEGSKLSGIEDGADVTANHTANNTNNVGSIPASNIAGWAHSSDTTTIDGGKIYTGTVTATQIAANTITANEIASHTITANELVTNTAVITNTAQIANGIITNAKIADATIKAAKIKDANITNAKIANAAVTTLKVDGHAITQPVSAYTAAATSVAGGTWVTVQSLSINVSYGPTVVWFSVYLYMEGLNVRRYVKARVRQGSTTIWESGELYNTSHTNYLGADNYPINEHLSGVIKTSSTGNLTFYLQCYFEETGGATRQAKYRSLVAMEVKR